MKRGSKKECRSVNQSTLQFFTGYERYKHKCQSLHQISDHEETKLSLRESKEQVTRASRHNTQDKNFEKFIQVFFATGSSTYERVAR